MRLLKFSIALPLILAGCGGEQQSDIPGPVETHSIDAAWTPPEGLPPFAERTDPNAGARSWMNRLEPTRNGVCNFTDKPPTERPADYVLTAWSGNVDIYTPPDTLTHQQTDGFLQSTFMNSGPVVAVRKDMDDLWIEPVGENVVLIIGANQFQCSRQAAAG